MPDQVNPTDQVKEANQKANNHLEKAPDGQQVRNASKEQIDNALDQNQNRTRGMTELAFRDGFVDSPDKRSFELLVAIKDGKEETIDKNSPKSQKEIRPTPTKQEAKDKPTAKKGNGKDADTGTLKAINEDQALPKESRDLAGFYQQMRTASKARGHNTEVIDRTAGETLAPELDALRVRDPQKLYKEYLASNPADDPHAESDSLRAITAQKKQLLEGYVSEPENPWQAFKTLPPDQQQEVIRFFESASQVGQDSIAQHAQNILQGKPVLDFVLAIDRAVRSLGAGGWKQELGHFCENLRKIATGQPVGEQSSIEKTVTMGTGVLVKGAQGVDEIGQHAHPRAFVNDTHQAAEAMRHGIGEAGDYYNQKILNNDLGSIHSEVVEAVNYAGENASTAVKEFPHKDASEQANTLGTAATLVFILAATRELVTPESAKKMELFNLTDEELEAKGIQRKRIQDVAPEDIVNPIDRAASSEAKIAQIKALSRENEPVVRNIMRTIDEKFNTTSEFSLKNPEDIRLKSIRPETLDKKPWFDIEHIRDSVRFRTAVDDLKDAPNIAKMLKQSQFEIIKCDVEKILEPGERGWRSINIDLRAPNGQIIEYQILPREMNEAGKSGNHALYKQWRERDPSLMSMEEKRLRRRETNDARKLADRAWNAHLMRSGIRPDELKKILDAVQNEFGGG